MRKLDSEPNPWRLEEAGTEEESATPSVAYGLVMTYVDDIFITAPAEITKAAAPKFRSSESSGPTSEPETVGETAVRFLGVEISTSKDADSRSVWHITQESFVKGLVKRQDGEAQPKKIPITIDQSLMTLDSNPATLRCLMVKFLAVGDGPQDDTALGMQ